MCVLRAMQSETTDCLVYLVFKNQLAYCAYIETSCTGLYRSVMYTGLATKEKWFLYIVGLKLCILKNENGQHTK